MPEKPSPKEIIKESRFIKELADEEDVSISGTHNAQELEIYNHVDDLLDQLNSEHKDWIQQKKDRFGSYLDNIPDEKLEKQYLTGLRRFIKVQNRLFKKVSPEETSKLSDSDYLKRLIESYTYDFILSLRNSQRNEVFPNTALEIAQKSYRLNPDAINKMKAQFPEFEDWIIEYALTGHYNNYQEYLQGISETLPKLKEKYPEMEDWVIETAAIRKHADPGGFLDGVNKDSKTYKEKYPLLENWIIMRAVIGNSGNPDAFLGKVVKSVESLEIKFPELSESIIIEAAVNHFNKAEDYLNKYQNDVVKLKQQFPGFGDGAIHKAARNNPSDPVGFLTNLIPVITDLQTKFPAFSKANIEHVAISNTVNPEGVLKNAVKLIGELKTEFLDFTDKEIEYAVIDVEKKARTKLQEVVDKFPLMAEKYPMFEAWVVRSLLIDRPSTYPFYLENLKIQSDNLHTQYPSMDYKNIVNICFFNKQKAEQILKERFKI